jgi:DNA-binding transcriptional MerR regulator
MLKISEFSRLAQVPAKTLRYYDEIGLFQPSKIDPQSGYRYYTVEQLAALNRIMALKALGLSLEQITVLVKENVSVDYLRELLRAKQVEVSRHIAAEQQRLQYVEATLRQLESETAPEKPLEVIVKRIEAQRVVAIRECVPDLSAVGEVSTRLFNTLFATLGAQRIVPAGAGIALYHDLEFTDHDIDLEICVPVEATTTINVTDPVRVDTLPAVTAMACVIHRGGYSDLGAAHIAILKWLAMTTYEVGSPNREVFLQHSPDPAQNVTEIQYPLH